MPLASTEPILLPLAPEAPAWFVAFHRHLLPLLQRNQQRIDQGQGLRGRPSISAPLEAYGKTLGGVGDAQTATDALNQRQAESLLATFGTLFLAEPHSWPSTQTFPGGLDFGGALLGTYEEQAFTVTGTGFAVSPTGTATLVAVGRQVQLFLPELTDTSNDTAFTVTGIPPALAPGFSTIQPVWVTDNGLDLFGLLVLVATATSISVVVAGGATTWTAAGVKRLYPTTVSYLLP